MQPHDEGVVIQDGLADRLAGSGIKFCEECVVLVVETAPIELAGGAVEFERLTFDSTGLYAGLSYPGQFSVGFVDVVEDSVRTDT